MQSQAPGRSHFAVARHLVAGALLHGCSFSTRGGATITILTEPRRQTGYRLLWRFCVTIHSLEVKSNCPISLTILVIKSYSQIIHNTIMHLECCMVSIFRPFVIVFLTFSTFRECTPSQRADIEDACCVFFRRNRERRRWRYCVASIQHKFHLLPVLFHARLRLS